MLAFLGDLSVLQVVCVLVGFSLLIFVHELGHFLAARLVGVRVEKFMIGIDAWGWGLCKKIGETEYGIGLLPFGGYVKLAGQSDMPGEEVVTGAPDELMSKGPWARLLVFVSGVVMNFILGFLILFGVAVYGVNRIPTVVGVVQKDSPSANAGLMPRDHILAIEGVPVRWWEEDLLQTVALAGDKPLDFLIQRGEGDTATTFHTTIHTLPGEGRGNLHGIQALPLASNIIFGADEVGPILPLMQEGLSVIGKAFQSNDEVLAIDGKPVKYQHEVDDFCAKHPGMMTTITVKRGEKTLDVPYRVPVTEFGQYDIGVRYGVMMLGATQPDAPCANAGIRKGDMIFSINDMTLGQDAVTDLQRLIRDASLGDVTVTVERDGVDMDVTLRASLRNNIKDFAGGASLPDTLLGVMLDPKGPLRVNTVIPGGPADGVLQVGDVLKAVKGKPLDSAQSVAGRVAAAAAQPIRVGYVHKGEEKVAELTPFFDERRIVPFIGAQLGRGAVYRVTEGSLAERMSLSQGDSNLIFELSADLTKTRVSWSPPKSETRASATIDTPQFVLDNPLAAGVRGSSGLIFQTMTELDRAPTFRAALDRATTRSIELGKSVFVMLDKLISGKMRITATGGPILIFKAMYQKAGQGMGRLFDLLALISINLGVLNLLPFPVLDGGHCFFLFIEMIKGSPLNGRLREYAQYAGFFVIVGFFLVVMGIDFYYVILGGA